MLDDSLREMSSAKVEPAPAARAQVGGEVEPGAGRRADAGRDNLTLKPARPYVVTPGELERTLREVLSQQAATASACVDPAARALGRARRVQRRRSIAGVAMAAIATVIASVAVTQLAGPPGHTRPAFVTDPSVSPFGPTVAPSRAVSAGPRPAPTRRPGVTEPPAVDIVAAAALWSARGEMIDVAQIGTVVQANSSRDGWLLVTSTASDRSTVWHVTAAGAPRAVLSGVDALALAPDGERVAWRYGPWMFVAPVEGGRLGEAERSPAPSGGRPIGFAGAAVLMVREGPGAGTNGYDLWWPGRAYTAAWQSQVTGVYGLLPDGRTLVAQVSVPGAARPCLALLDSARALAVVKRTCAPGLSPGGRGAVSPDGRWLVANGVPEPGTGAAGSAERALVVDLGAAFGGRPVVKAAEPRLTGDVVWIGGQAFVHAGEQGYLVRVTLDPVATGGEPAVEKITTVGESAGYRMVVVGGCVAALMRPASPVTSCR